MGAIAENGGEAIWIEADVSQAGQVSAMVQQAVDTYGRLDYAFNNAAGGRPGDARRILDAAVASPPSSSRDAFRAHQQLARLNLELNDVQAAGLHALRAVALHRVDGSGWALLASFLESAEGAPEAVDRARSLAVEIRAQQAPGRRGGAR